MADTIRVLPRSPGVLFGVQITCPFQTGLTVNHLYRRGSDGKPKLKAAAKAWREQLAWQVRPFYHDVRLAVAAGGRIVVGWDIYVPNYQAKPDADNLVKLIFDGVKMGLEIDDREFSAGGGRVEVDAQQPRIEIYISVEG